MVQKSSNGDPAESNLSRDDEHAVKGIAATLYGAAAADTVVPRLTNFILAMIMTPEVQRKAQEEMDCVTGNERLPGFLDRGNLPYIESVVKEIHRWSPIPPFGMPHLADADLVYKDHLIPKGAVLVPAVWWFLYDPEVYINPSPFSPERYLEPRNELDPMNVAFVFGRRIFPGRYSSDSTIFLTVA